MNVTGVIAEYNPFHNGHRHHLSESREKTGADYVIAVMSGDFVQRGTPAILNKYERTRMALSCGADLVLELPCGLRHRQRRAFCPGRRRTAGQPRGCGRAGFRSRGARF